MKHQAMERKELLIYQKAHGERRWKALNLFFRISRTTRHVASFLGPNILDYELRKLKSMFGLFYLRHEDRQRVLDLNLPPFSKRWGSLSRIYIFQKDKLDWCIQNLDVCLENLDRIDSRKEVIDISSHPFLDGNLGYHTGLHTLQLFMAETNTSVIEKTSIMRFIRSMTKGLSKECADPDIFDTIKLFERRLKLLSSFLQYKFDVETHLTKIIY